MTYIALEDLDFMWSDADVTTVKRKWNDGISLESIAVIVKRPVDEVTLLIMDLVIRKQIKQRRSGAFGHTVNHKQSPMRLYRCYCGVTFGWAGNEKDQKHRECPSCGGKSLTKVQWDLGAEDAL